ncbi:hypothetical protein [Devosia lacusdianchii]|uniref:hypothetical protein n=1 Tax=Devosia lacusdianchii TaxID=2917991 RepID=UPI001F051EE1|nr:hypothetical protein [Devosia sp. JXJ CY 41]
MDGGRERRIDAGAALLLSALVASGVMLIGSGQWTPMAFLMVPIFVVFGLTAPFSGFLGSAGWIPFGLTILALVAILLALALIPNRAARIVSVTVLFCSTFFCVAPFGLLTA